MAACSGGAEEAAPTAAADEAAPTTSSVAGARTAQALRLRLVTVARGFDSPVHVTSTRSEPGRLYVVEQGGVIRVLVNGQVRATPFLDISDLVSCCGEQGLLSMAFHPQYATNRRFYVNYTDNAGDTRIVEYRSNGTVAREGTRRQLLWIDQPYSNHNGGQVAFGPDGFLYIGMGDGGSGGDPENRAQRLSSRLGKLLRLNVNVAGAKPSIAAYGLRNPWRFSFDRARGHLWIADVGQNEWEEVNFVGRGSDGLENYGWDVYEGREIFERKAPNARGRLVRPVAVYSHSAGCSVTGGFVYRGARMSALRGRYFYGDYCSGNIWSLRIRDGKASGLRREPFKVELLTSFGEDVRGELYLTSHNGSVYRLTSS